ncbi:MFS transporter [Streptomyces sp. NPDC079020]|uniref:MFS transporter n=1 Tax=Streptomyces sp. NPDC079020 TaxID=3365722 RepID=UPI0037D335C1
MTTPRSLPAVTAADLPALQRRTSAVLIASQMLGGLGVPIAIALAPVLATEVSGSEAFSGLASTASVAGTALLSLPLAALMTARGRRPGLVVAYLIGALGAGLVVLATVVSSFPLLLLGMAAFGAGSSANLQARFAAADLAGPDRRGRAISTVIWATTIGSVLGPNITAPAGRLFRGTAVPENAGPFLIAAAIFLLAGLVVAVLLRPDPLLTARALAPDDGPAAGKRSLRTAVAAVRAAPMARLALVTVAVSHTAMVSIMVMTPVHLGRHGADLQLIGLVISGHIAGMYAFSPVMGWLSDRLGRLAVIGLAVGLLACAALLAGTAGHRDGQTAAGLFVLGLGWSAGMIAGSALLTDSVPPAARAAVQGLSDLTMNTAAGVGGAVAGVIVSQWGYGPLNAIGACLLLPMAALALRRSLRPDSDRAPDPNDGQAADPDGNRAADRAADPNGERAAGGRAAGPAADRNRRLKD